MYILSDKQLTSAGYLSYLPPGLKTLILKAPQENLCEIRLRRQRPVILIYVDGKYYLAKDGGITKDRQQSYIATTKDISRASETAFEFSLYAHEDELSQGYITIRGGHRIGICGEVKDGKIRSLTDISSLNYRIAHEHIGIAEAVKADIIKDNQIRSTLIISPPMCGKTSLLRDTVRLLSSEGIKVGVCDSRGEIAAVYDGEPCLDIGDADVLSGTSKAEGMSMLLRTMSPEVIVCDEIGSLEDARAVAESLSSGTAIIATAHCSSKDELFSHSSLAKTAKQFKVIITLGGIGEIQEVYYA